MYRNAKIYAAGASFLFVLAALVFTSWNFLFTIFFLALQFLVFAACRTESLIFHSFSFVPSVLLLIFRITGFDGSWGWLPLPIAFSLLSAVVIVAVSRLKLEKARTTTRYWISVLVYLVLMSLIIAAAIQA